MWRYPLVRTFCFLCISCAGTHSSALYFHSFHRAGTHSSARVFLFFFQLIIYTYRMRHVVSRTTFAFWIKRFTSQRVPTRNFPSQTQTRPSVKKIVYRMPDLTPDTVPLLRHQTVTLSLSHSFSFFYTPQSFIPRLKVHSIHSHMAQLNTHARTQSAVANFGVPSVYADAPLLSFKHHWWLNPNRIERFIFNILFFRLSSLVINDIRSIIIVKFIILAIYTTFVPFSTLTYFVISHGSMWFNVLKNYHTSNNNSNP